MSETIRFHLDEQMPAALARALRLHSIDVTRPMEVGLMGARDVEHIAFALGAQRVIVTHDYDFLRHHNAGMAHAGIAFSLQGAMALGPLIEALVLVHSCMTSEEIHGRVEYLSPYSG